MDAHLYTTDSVYAAAQAQIAASTFGIKDAKRRARAVREVDLLIAVHDKQLAARKLQDMHELNMCQHLGVFILMGICASFWVFFQYPVANELQTIAVMAGCVLVASLIGMSKVMTRALDRRHKDMQKVLLYRLQHAESK